MATGRICLGDLCVNVGLGLGMCCYIAHYDRGHERSVLVLKIPLNAVLVNKSSKSIS